jgi:hypothetical protein
VKLTRQPALAREIAFYQLITSTSRTAPLAGLKPFVPQFYGTLRLEGKLEAQGTVDQKLVEAAEVPEVGNCPLLDSPSSQIEMASLLGADPPSRWS